MSDAHDTAQWSGADLARLEALLHAPPHSGQALTADALQAMFTAMAMGPDEEASDDWPAAALGAEPGTSPPADPELLALMERFRGATARAVADGTLEPLLYTLRRGHRDYATWCDGFLLGVELSPTDWHEAADPEDVDELLFPFWVLADAMGEEERAAYSPAAWRNLVLDSEAHLVDSLLRLRDYWTIVRTPPQTVRRDARRVGRNDPCPCGSGRKHKHCCGRAR
jgi:uncharacterized protein